MIRNPSRRPDSEPDGNHLMSYFHSSIRTPQENASSHTLIVDSLAYFFLEKNIKIDKK